MFFSSNDNILLLCGDTCHLFGHVLLLYAILKKKSCLDISPKSQLLFALAYTAGFLDLMLVVPLYYTPTKLLYVLVSWTTLFLMIVFYRESYDKKNDTFIIETLLLPIVIIGLFVNYQMKEIGVLWTFSTLLEAVAILPQFYRIVKTQQLTKELFVFLLFLGLYRAFYLPQWFYTYYYSTEYVNWLSVFAEMLNNFVFFIGLIYIMFGREVVFIDVNEESMLKKNIFFISNNAVESRGLGADVALLKEKNDSQTKNFEVV